MTKPGTVLKGPVLALVTATHRIALVHVSLMQPVLRREKKTEAVHRDVSRTRRAPKRAILGVPAIVIGTLFRRPVFINREEIVDLVVDIEASAGRVLIGDGPACG